MPTQLRLYVLGPPLVRLDETDIRLGAAPSVLLYYLALSPQPVPRRALMHLLRDDRGAGGTHAAYLRNLLQRLVERLGEAYVIRTRQEAALNRERLWVDALEFGRLAQPQSILMPAQLKDSRLPLENWKNAAALYRGNFLQGLRVKSRALQKWREEQERAWEQRILALLHNLSEALFLREEYDEALRYASRWQALEETNETAHRLLMKIYWRQGKHAKAIEQYRACRAVLQRYELDPTAPTEELYQRIRSSRSAAGRGATRRRAAGSLRAESASQPPAWKPPVLPTYPTPFIGRQDDLAYVVARLQAPECRLLTLLAPGGMGKTRLAVQAGEKLKASFADGVLFVDLSRLPASADLLNALYVYLPEDYRDRSRHENPGDAVLDFMSKRQMLLILDNFEHLTPQAARLTDLLQKAQNITCLVTSRERLNLSEEWVYPLDGLSYPQASYPKSLTPLDARYSAVKLFVQRAQQSAPHFTLTDANRAAVTRICQIVEGMPLAIEMAAVWVQHLSCEAIASSLQQHLDILESAYRNIVERHRSIRASCDHSWNLLTDAERRGLSRLAVFHNGCDYRAVAAIAGLSLPEIANLHNKSWLRSNRGRYSLHALIHQYLSKRLDEDPALREETRRRHARYYAGMLQQAAQNFHGAGQKDALEEVSRDLENIEAAWDWAVREQDLDLLDSMSRPLFEFYRLRNFFIAGKERYQHALRRIGLEEAARRHPAYEHIRNRLAWFTYISADLTRAKTLWEEGLQRAQERGETCEIAFCYQGLGLASQDAGEYDQAVAYYTESLRCAKEQGLSHDIAQAQKQLGYVFSLKRDFHKAETLYRRCLAIYESLNDRYNIAVVYSYLSDCAYEQKRRAQATHLAQQAIEIATETGNQRLHALALNRLARTLPPAEAVRIHTTVAMIFESLGDWTRTGISYNNIAGELMQLGNFPEAEETYRNALDLFKRHNDRRGVFFTTFNLGRMYLRWQPEGALRYLRSALLQALGMNAISLGLYALSGYAEFYQVQGDWPRALCLASFILNHPDVQEDATAYAEEVLCEATRTLGALNAARWLVPLPPAEYHRLVDEIAREGAFTLPGTAAP